jgi:hypothetical protein
LRFEDVPGAAVEPVVAPQAADQVVATQRADHVVAGRADEAVVADRAADRARSFFETGCQSGPSDT